MDREQVLAIIRDAIEAAVTHAGLVRMPVLSESPEQVAIDVVDALENAGFAITKSVDR
jgi:isopropylmalate/homocitrate/citramalate synthase